MENKIQIEAIGKVKVEKGIYCIEVNKEFRTALKNIEEFSHLQIVWWGNLYDNPQYRKTLVAKKPYVKGPDEIGMFASRSPVRPNPILLTSIYVQKIDQDNGLIYTPYIDAEHNTPVLDIKPYHLSERIRECSVPQWCKHWPQWYEDSATFDWQAEFNF